ncbi:MAG: hypothetical protein CL666_07915 [Balneola sp.]|nr:hypothetical protein [Balneola sp.]|tara:strand:- start:8493 stop:9002 length:510 start_codon:yes stop_codon:yes gene_type:complete
MDEHIEFNRIRPRIYVETPLSAEEVNQRIRKELRSESRLCDGQSTKGFATICPPEKDQHFWSPQLTITLEETEERSVVRGLYGPKPSVWTMFVFFYAAIGFAILIMSMVGLSYWSLGKSAGFLWLLPVLVFLFFTLYGVAYFGQKLGQKQMTNLHRFLERCLNEEIDAI